MIETRIGPLHFENGFPEDTTRKVLDGIDYQRAVQSYLWGQIDERLHYSYGAIYTTPALGVMRVGPGGNYMQAFKDKNGDRLDGGQKYRLRVPANAPAEQFWSLTLYDTEDTR